MSEDQKTGPSITVEQIESRIVLEAYSTGDQFGVEFYPEMPKDERIRLFRELDLVTVCILVLDNGFKVTGESACVSRANFNAEVGRREARKAAVAKIWALEGYLLKERLWRGAAPPPPVPV